MHLENPDYAYLRGLFEKILSDIHAVDDSNFDWCPQPRKCVADVNQPMVSAESVAASAAEMEQDADECVPMVDTMGSNSAGMSNASTSEPFCVLLVWLAAASLY